MYLKTNRGSLTVFVEFIYSISNKYQHILLTPKLQNKIIPHNIIINYILFNLYIRFQRLKQYFQTKNGNFLSRGFHLKSTISTERQMKGTGKEICTVVLKNSIMSLHFTCTKIFLSSFRFSSHT